MWAIRAPQSATREATLMIISFTRSRRAASNEKAADWVAAASAEEERARADKVAGAAPRPATLPRSGLLGPPPVAPTAHCAPRQLPHGNQFCVAVTWPDGRFRQVGVFKTATDAQTWIDRSSNGWLATL
jgi:hypothetical protein